MEHSTEYTDLSFLTQSVCCYCGGMVRRCGQVAESGMDDVSGGMVVREERRWVLRECSWKLGDSRLVAGTDGRRGLDEVGMT